MLKRLQESAYVELSSCSPSLQHGLQARHKQAEKDGGKEPGPIATGREIVAESGVLVRLAFTLAESPVCALRLLSCTLLQADELHAAACKSHSCRAPQSCSALYMAGNTAGQHAYAQGTAC